jgi:alkyl hydroperoxide reductase subunit AhpF
MLFVAYSVWSKLYDGAERVPWRPDATAVVPPHCRIVTEATEGGRAAWPSYPWLARYPFSDGWAPLFISLCGGGKEARLRAEEDLDCMVIGGGPAGLTAALYFARFRRRFLVIDAGASRAAWIPTSHNIPFFAAGISAPEILQRQRETAQRYGVRILNGTATSRERRDDGFVATVNAAQGGSLQVAARRVLLATGAVDIEPDLPDVRDAVQRGLVRYCPICDEYESRDMKIAVIGHGAAGLGEAVFIAHLFRQRDITDAWANIAAYRRRTRQCGTPQYSHH